MLVGLLADGTCCCAKGTAFGGLAGFSAAYVWLLLDLKLINAFLFLSYLLSAST